MVNLNFSDQVKLAQLIFEGRLWVKKWDEQMIAQRKVHLLMA